MVWTIDSLLSINYSTATLLHYPITPLPHSRFNDPDVGEVAKLLGVVQPVADHEPIFDREADVFDFHIDFAARRLAEEARGSQYARTSGPENVLEIEQCHTGV